MIRCSITRRHCTVRAHIPETRLLPPVPVWHRLGSILIEPGVEAGAFWRVTWLALRTRLQGVKRCLPVGSPCCSSLRLRYTGESVRVSALRLAPPSPLKNRKVGSHHWAGKKTVRFETVKAPLFCKRLLVGFVCGVRPPAATPTFIPCMCPALEAGLTLQLS